MPVHLSIHDVTPAWAQQIDTVLEWAHELNLRPALLVVPNYRGHWPLREYSEFCARLRSLQSIGHEIYLHGYYHQAPAEMSSVPSIYRRVSSNLSRRYYQNFVSANEAEFGGISGAEAGSLLDRGRADLDEVGLHCDGFVAPAWAMPRAHLRELAERGFRFAEDHFHVYDPVAHRQRFTVLINYATRTPARLVLTTAFARLAKNAEPFVPVRIAIHPADLRSTFLRAEIQRLLAWASERRLARATELLHCANLGR